MLPPPFTLTTEKRQNRFLIQDVTPFLNNINFQYTNPLPFESEPQHYILFHWHENTVTLIFITFDKKHLI